MNIKTHSGLGDAVYSYPVIRHFANSRSVTVVTSYPIVFSALKNVTAVTPEKFSGVIDLFLKYTHLRRTRNTQYEDICSTAGVEPPEFSLDWHHDYSEEFLSAHFEKIYHGAASANKKICVIKEPVAAHMDKSIRSFRYTPSATEIQRFINKNAEKFYFISVGQNEVFRKRLFGIDYDLNDKISVRDLITLCKNARHIATQIGHLLPIAQAFKKDHTLFMPESGMLIERSKFQIRSLQDDE